MNAIYMDDKIQYQTRETQDAKANFIKPRALKRQIQRSRNQET